MFQYIQKTTDKRQQRQHTKQITHYKHIAHLAIAYCPKYFPKHSDKYKIHFGKLLHFDGRSL